MEGNLREYSINLVKLVPNAYCFHDHFFTQQKAHATNSVALLTAINNNQPPLAHLVRVLLKEIPALPKIHINFYCAGFGSHKQPEATSLKVAVSYYNASTKTKPQNLVRDVLVSCKKLGFDRSVAFDTLDNQKFLSDPGLEFLDEQDLRPHFLYPLLVDLKDVKPEETTFSLILP